MSRTKAQMKEAKKLLRKPPGKFVPVDLNEYPAPSWMTRVFKNNRYVVMINDNAPMTGGIMAIRAMVQRHDDQPIPNHWREMQAIKSELFGPEVLAVEYYPPESELMDCANIYWIWIFPDDFMPRAILQRGQ